MRCKAVLKKFKAIENFIAGVICLIITAFFVWNSVMLFTDEIRFNEASVAIKGEVVEVKTVKRGAGSKHFSAYTKKAYVFYEFNGKKYEHIELYRPYDKGEKKGDIVIMYIDPENPEDVRNTTELVGGKATACISLLFFVISISCFVSMRKKRKKEKLSAKKLFNLTKRVFAIIRQ